MTLLIIGVSGWILIHLYPVLMHESRANLIDKMGTNPYKAIFALLILASVAAIVLGWRSFSSSR